MSTKKFQITKKIERINDYIKILSGYRDLSISHLKAVPGDKAAIERFLYLACDSLISLMEMIISFKELSKALTYSENIDILLENKVLNEKQAKLLYQIIGFRNILSHDYEKLDLSIVMDIVNNKLNDIGKIAGYLGKSIES